MKIRIPLIIVFMMLLISCTALSRSLGGENGDGAENAVKKLVEDSVSALSSECVTTDDLSSALPSSYTSYASYIPSYDEMKEEYLSALCGIVNRYMASAFSSYVLSSCEEISSDPSPYFSGLSIAMSLKSSLSPLLTESLVLYLDEHSSELDAAFSPSREVFARVKKAYAGLSAVSRGIILPSATPLMAEDIAGISVERYFSLLSDEEIRLRSNPLYGDHSLYLENMEI